MQLGIDTLRKRIALASRAAILLIAVFGFVLPNIGLLPAYAQSAAGAVPLASAAIDHTLYRDGEVRRLSGTFAAWTLVCDEVTRLKQRFCSLNTIARDATGATVAALTVSTGEDGRPAALLRIPASSGPNGRVEIAVMAKPSAPAGSTAAAKTPPPSKPSEQVTHLRPPACDPAICTVVWTLPPAHIKALNLGGAIQVRYPKPVSEQDLAALQTGRFSLAPPPRPMISGTIDTGGFAAAVDASIKFGR